MNNYFCTIGPSLASKLPRVNKHFNDFMTIKIEETIFLSPTSEHEIEKEIKKNKSNKTAGADNFSPRLIMKCSTFITKPLCIIYNHALESASYPTALKLAKVLALHKKNCKLLPERQSRMTVIPFLLSYMSPCNLTIEILSNYQSLHNRHGGTRSVDPNEKPPTLITVSLN